jgi:hypothetical protein
MVLMLIEFLLTALSYLLPFAPSVTIMPNVILGALAVAGVAGPCAIADARRIVVRMRVKLE